MWIGATGVDRLRDVVNRFVGSCRWENTAYPSRMTTTGPLLPSFRCAITPSMMRLSPCDFPTPEACAQGAKL